MGRLWVMVYIYLLLWGKDRLAYCGNVEEENGVLVEYNWAIYVESEE